MQEAHGAPQVLGLREVSLPELRPSDVLIRVHACGVCFHDVVVRIGLYRRGVKLPLIPGHEVAGTVERVGAEVRRFDIGDRVCTVQRRSTCGVCRPCITADTVGCINREFMGDAGLNGGYAEFVAVDERCVARVPRDIALDSASIVACAIGTQLNAIRDVGRVRVGETVLVTGAAGGQGAHGVQVARACGARVIALTSSHEKAERLRDIGAHSVVVAARGEDFALAVRELTDGEGVHVAIDNVGASIFHSIRRSLARGGRWVLVGALDERTTPLNTAQIFTRNISLLSAASCTLPQLEDALEFVTKALVRPLVAHRYALGDAAMAHAALEEIGHRSHRIGKCILKIQ